MHRRCLLLSLFVVCAPAYQTYVSHSFPFPLIPYSAGVYHIHSPNYFMGAHGFAMPGFKLLETSKPRVVRDYVHSEFVFQTHFGKTSARMFSNSLNTSHLLLMDPDGVPCLLGRLTLQRCSARGFIVSAHADLLRPASVWERCLGGRRRVKQSEVLRAINLGYSDFRSELNLKRYVNMVYNTDKKDKDI